MTLPLPVNGPSLTPEERQAFMTRKGSIMIIPLGDIDFAWLSNYACNVHLLVEGIIQLTLHKSIHQGDWLDAVAQSSTHPERFRQWLERELNHLSEPMRCARVIFERINEAWRLSRFNDASMSIYEAHVQRFIGDAVAIEVMYRDFSTRL
jgi:hypothetical protein